MKQIGTETQITALAASCTAHRSNEYFYLPFLSAAIAGREDIATEAIMRAALAAGIRLRAIDEIIMQSHLFLGFPAMIEAARIFGRVHPRRYGKKTLPQAYDDKAVKSWNKDGLDKIRHIYGPAFDRLVAYINSFSPQVLTWMINDGYGQVLSRPGVSFQLRELSVVATLTVTSYTNQLGAHIRGALNVGVATELLDTTIENCGHFCSKSRVTVARTLLKKAVSV